MIRILFLWFLFVSSAIYAQDSIEENGKVNQKNYLETIDFEVINNKIIVPTSINGKTYHFMLDTGAPNLISEQLQKELNINVIQEIPVSDANNIKQTMKLVELPEISLGNLTIENTLSLSYDFHKNPFFQCLNIDGIIGSNLFKDKAVKISLKEKKLYVTDKVKKLNPKTKRVKLQLIGWQLSPYIKIELEGNKTRGIEPILIDTGMDGFYDISNRNFSQLKDYDTYSQQISSIGIGGFSLFEHTEKQEQHLVTIPKLTVGKAAFLNVSAETMNDNNSRIGLDLLKYGDIIIDFKKKKFYFENTSEIALKNAPKFGLNLKDNTWIIDFVWDEELQKQIQHGDELVRIDDILVKDMDLCEILTVKQYIKNNSSYEIEVINSENKSVTIQIQQD